MHNPFGENQKKGSIICKGFGHSTMLYSKESKSLYMCGCNKFGQFGIGNNKSHNTFQICNNP